MNHSIGEEATAVNIDHDAGDEAVAHCADDSGGVDERPRPAKSQRVMQAMLKMVKLDIQKLKDASAGK